jgi:FtsZ-binding cell division protein ZapB
MIDWLRYFQFNGLTQGENMRYLLLSALLLIGLSSLQAATFLERFNSLEQELENVQDDIDALKKGGGAKGSSNASGTKALEAEIAKLKKSQETLQTEVSKLKKQPRSKGSSKAAANEDVKALQKAIKKLKKEQASLNNKLRANPGKSSGLQASDEGMDEGDLDDIQEQFDEMSKKISEIRKFTNGNHMKITADFRSSVDHIKYIMADRSRQQNNGVLSNRLWLNMKYKATQNISFTGQLAYNKTFGARSGNTATNNFAAYDQFDWLANEKALSDDTVRLKKAYFFYANNTFLGLKMPWTFSIGRRPSTNGHLAHFREDDEPSSPMAHSINVEFDGLSSKFDISHYTGISGQYIKFCLGRGGTNAAESLTSTPYAEDKSATKNIELAGAIISLYNNGHYSLTTQTYYANNLIDVNQTTAGRVFVNTGDINNFSVNFLAEGIGTEGSDFLWSEWLGRFLDSTVFFVSYATSVTQPYEGGSMFGSTENKRGQSYWVGLHMPTFSEKGKWGLEYNKGDKYWRSITYAEDTLIGSKVAARGEAYEIYWTEPFANDVMSWQLRFTYIDYKYTGSNGFFGDTTGTPYTMQEAIAGGNGANVVDKASDLRFYLRYRY